MKRGHVQYIIWIKATLIKMFEGALSQSRIMQSRLARDDWNEASLFTAKWHFQNLFEPVVNDKNALEVFVKNWKRILNLRLSTSIHTNT